MTPSPSPARLPDGWADAIDQALRASGHQHRTCVVVEALAPLATELAAARDRAVAGHNRIEADWAALRADERVLREALEEARESFADLLRHHTRAIWTLAGEAEYPPAERTQTGLRAQAALAALDTALAAVADKLRGENERAADDA